MDKDTISTTTQLPAMTDLAVASDRMVTMIIALSLTPVIHKANVSIGNTVHPCQLISQVTLAMSVGLTRQ